MTTQAGITAAIGLMHPWVEESVLLIALSAAVVILGTLLLGGEATQERIFRLLRFLWNRTEPPNPPRVAPKVAVQKKVRHRV